jgi:cbb3-type cytochrome oxidase subunit 3
MLVIALLLVSILGAWWVARDANRRGMHAKGWALFMLLTSLIGLPFYLFARRRHKPLL